MEAEFNANLKLLPEEVEAMQNGSMFGWHIPGADVDFIRSAKKNKLKVSKES